MRSWRRITLAYPGDDPEPLIVALHALGSLGTEIRGDHVVAWFEEGARPVDLPRRLAAAGCPGQVTIVGEREVPDARWHERWMRRQTPFAVGARFLVVPSQDDAAVDASGRLVIRVPPGRAFGTGDHATTRLCLAGIERTVRPGGALLDLGTGSGILAIAAWQIGARPVIAIDRDAEAARAAQRNARLSDAGGIGFAVADVDAINACRARGRFDTIVANLDAPTLQRALPAIASLGPRRAILSGLLEADQTPVSARADGVGLAVAECARDQGWIALTLAARP